MCWCHHLQVPNLGDPPGDTAAQTRDLLASADATLTAVGSSRSRLLSVTIYVCIFPICHGCHPFTSSICRRVTHICRFLFFFLAFAQITEAADLAAMNAVWEAWLPLGCAPSRACLRTGLVTPGMLVEMAFVAAGCDEASSQTGPGRSA